MKSLTTALVVASAMAVSIPIATLVQPTAAPAPKSQRKDHLNDPDLFFVVTTDRHLGRLTREEWLSMSEADARIYWEAWNCKDRPCDTTLKAEIRAKARLVPRTKKNFGLIYKSEG